MIDRKINTNRVTGDGRGGATQLPTHPPRPHARLGGGGGVGMLGQIAQNKTNPPTHRPQDPPPPKSSGTTLKQRSAPIPSSVPVAPNTTPTLCTTFLVQHDQKKKVSFCHKISNNKSSRVGSPSWYSLYCPCNLHNVPLEAFTGLFSTCNTQHICISSAHYTASTRSRNRCLQRLFSCSCLSVFPSTRIFVSCTVVPPPTPLFALHHAARP